MINHAEQARRLADLEASFVAELTKLNTMTTLATSAARPADLATHVANWLADWREYHARNGHTPLIKAALEVALTRVDPHRVAAAVWTFHRQDNSPANSANSATEAVSSTARVVVPAAGSRFGAQQVAVDGTAVDLPGTVVQALREIASGSARIWMRLETWRKLETTLPWLVPHLKRNNDLKADSRRNPYDVAPLARHLIAVA
jgi:hypothetical protein